MNEAAIKLLPSIVSVLMFVLQGLMILVIKFNDFKHLEATVTGIENYMKEDLEWKKQISERLARVEGRCEAYHSIAEARKK